MANPVKGISFHDQIPGDKEILVPDAGLLKRCREGERSSVAKLVAYQGSGKSLHCVRVGFWDKPSGVDPAEYVSRFSGVTKLHKGVAGYCFDVGFASATLAEMASQRNLFFDGISAPHFMPCSSEEGFAVFLFQTLSSTLLHSALEAKLMNGLEELGRVLFFQLDKVDGFPRYAGDTAIALLAYQLTIDREIPKKFYTDGVRELVELDVPTHVECLSCSGYHLGDFDCKDQFAYMRRWNC